MPYAIEISEAAYDELKEIKSLYRRQIIEAIDKQLAHQPTIETRNRKPLIGLQPDFAHQIPVWELRVRSYRVYYDVNEKSQVVSVRAVRQKPPHVSTERIV
jgi:mRNA-degrading endonuclease RelE of RelBE toxin-antitoxin system